MPEAASSLLLPMLAGYQRAAAKLMLGESFSAAEAHAMGLVNEVLPVGEVLLRAESKANKLASLPAGAVLATKALMKTDMAAVVERRMQIEGEEFRARLSSPEARAAFESFLARSK